MKIEQIVICAALAALSSACGDDFEPSPHDVDGGSGAGGSGASGGAGATGGSGGGTGGSGATGGTGATGGSGATGGTAGGGGSAGSADAGPYCPPSHRCLPEVPSGWQGPIADSDGPCGGEWPDQALLVSTGLNAPAAQCACTCTAAAKCPTALAFHSAGSGSCSFTGNGAALAVGECKGATALPVNGIRLPAATVTCSATVQETITPPTWTSTHQLCAGGSPGGECANSNETCVPDPGAALCVYQAGDHACPASYPDKHSYFTGFTDTRDCPATCGCTPGGTAQCKSTLTSYGGVSCSGGATSTTTLYSGGAATCYNGSAKGAAITATQNGTCTPQNVIGTGSAVPADPITVCCAP